MSVEYMERVYNTYSGVYDVLFGKVFQSGRELGPELLDLFPGAKLLEVGIGTGLSRSSHGILNSPASIFPRACSIKPVNALSNCASATSGS